MFKVDSDLFQRESKRAKAVSFVSYAHAYFDFIGRIGELYDCIKSFAGPTSCCIFFPCPSFMVQLRRNAALQG